MYKCLRCGGIFDECDLHYKNSCYGEYQGVSACKSEPCCPLCGYETEYLDDGDEGVIK